MTIYPVGCRDLYVVIKINTLEEMSSGGACYLLYRVDIAVSVRADEDLLREWSSMWDWDW